MANGEVWIEITVQNGKYTFSETANTTDKAVVFTTDGHGFQLTAEQGIYAFTFTANGFQFAAGAVSWAQPNANRNLTWASKDKTQFAMTDINYAKSPQTVAFTINPDNSLPVDGAPPLPPIDPTVLNNPLPGNIALIPPADEVFHRDLVMAG